MTGDSEGVREAKSLVPEVEEVVVKESCSLYGGLCYSTAVTHRKIHDAARKVAEKGSTAKPFVIPGPITMKIDFFETDFAKEYQSQFGPAVFHGESVLSCWAQYLANKGKMN